MNDGNNTQATQSPSTGFVVSSKLRAEETLRRNNTIALNISMHGINAITSTQKLELEVIANMCPYVGGSAVYKARTLWSIYNPMAQYNDRLMCMQNLSSNKGEIPSYYNIDSLNDAVTIEQANALAAQIRNNTKENQTVPIITQTLFDDVTIYPNPASEYIIINNLKQDGIFTLYDIVGKVISHTKVNGNTGTQKIILPEVSNGIYNYKIVIAGDAYIGKLNIMQHE